MKVRYLHLLTLFAALAVLAITLVPSGGVAFAQSGTVTVTGDQLNVRSAPSTSASIMTVLNHGDVVAIYGTVQGEEVSPGNSTWYQTKSGWYIYSGSISATAGQGASADTGHSGRWIDANLSAATVTAMEGNTPVHTALSTIGTANNPTPTGSFTIQRRVYDETMDSSTIGIPNNAPGGYYLTGVLYTQYFTGEGHALHYNYWSPASAFGSQAGSHGCLGLTLGDAAYFWNFASVGTPVVIHY